LLLDLSGHRRRHLIGIKASIAHQFSWAWKQAAIRAKHAIRAAATGCAYKRTDHVEQLFSSDTTSGSNRNVRHLKRRTA
jgi:hypothetical protein